MTDEKKVVEITEEALMDMEASGGANVTIGDTSYPMTTGLTKKCEKFDKGPNDWPILAIKGTCAQCRHFKIKKGYHVCGHPERISR